jgi:hypothetical protein
MLTWEEKEKLQLYIPELPIPGATRASTGVSNQVHMRKGIHLLDIN